MAETVTQTVDGGAQTALTASVVEGPDAGASAHGEETLTIGTAAGNHLVLTDPAVSRFHIELAHARHGLAVIDHRSTNGTWLGSSGVRVESAVVPAGTVLKIGDSLLRVGESTVTVPRGDVFAGERLGGLVGRSTAMRRVMAQVAQLATSDASVLVVGESGTGKELVARALHEQGRRASRPLVTVDCGSLAPTLVASELFGHERGAFTGADQRREGAIEQADGGTLFLDEIGELPEQLQAVLLGVLERRRFRRLGGRQDITVDVRLVTATNRDLRAEVNARRFRLDLYHRIAVVAIQLPPLRERPTDVPLLIEHFLADAQWQRPMADLFSTETVRALESHYFPGNVRELRNLVEAAIALGTAPSLGAEPARAADDLPYKDARAAVLGDFEHAYLRRLMERTDHNASEAARRACLTRSHLLHLLQRHKLR
ncbi:MAG: sigma 54-interacting transcriptional regulator [Kofleriaceae bacterium]